MTSETQEIFPCTTPSTLLAFQFSSWYPKFASLSIKSTIIRPLSTDFRAYLDADGVFVPEGAENLPAENTLSDDEDEEEEEDEEEAERRKYAFPELDARIRAAIEEYGAVFPKLNFSSPRDAAWILPASSPLKCVSPADVYLLLKSSDFVQHDLDRELVFDGCDSSGSGADASQKAYELELVLRKWYPVDRSRELRCFVRGGRLIGISQRDPNYYNFWNEADTQIKVLEAVKTFWQDKIRGKWAETHEDYIFDFLLTRSLSSGHVLDFNPYLSRTDSLLFTYDDLHALYLTSADRDKEPELRVVDSPHHPAATRNAPAHQHNMVPLEALAFSSERNAEDFAGVLQEEIKKSMQEEN